MIVPEHFPIAEKKARARLGVSRDELRAIRNAHLVEGTHYVRGQQHSVWLSEAGLAALSAAVLDQSQKTAPARSLDDLATSRAKLLSLLRARGYVAPTAEPDPAEIRLLVVRADLRNARLLLACAIDDDPDRPKKTVRVRVRSAENFVRRMEIPVRLVAGYDDLYDLARNCPRQKGKW